MIYKYKIKKTTTKFYPKKEINPFCPFSINKTRLKFQKNLTVVK